MNDLMQELQVASDDAYAHERGIAQLRERIRVLEGRNQALEDTACHREGLLAKVQRLCQDQAAKVCSFLDRIEELESHVAELQDMLDCSRAEIRKLTPEPETPFEAYLDVMSAYLPDFPLTVSDNPIALD